MPLLDAFETAKLLKKYALPAPETRLCKSLGEVLAAATELRFPLVLKVASTQESHKTERGLVQLGINTLDELSLAFKHVQKKSKGLAVDAFVLQEQLGGFELIVGGKTDPVFGKTILFGSGGILTELLEDYALRVAPITRKDAFEMIQDTRASAFFKGFRGSKANEGKMVDLLLKASKLLVKEAVSEFDFNPVIANERQASIVDARIVVGG